MQILLRFPAEGKEIRAGLAAAAVMRYNGVLSEPRFCMTA
jgi:hypothetical protein